MQNNTASKSTFSTGFLRTRWAAIGAAVAVSLGAGGFGLANAAVSEGEKPVYIAIDPCRLSDTRPEFLVGGRATPYGPTETVTLVGTGAQGNCNVPGGVSSLALNVTALDATQPSFLQFAPGNTVTPGGASSLNPVPGEPPTPNAVTISIDDEGEFSIYNLAGTVNVIIDIVGYYDDHVHTGADIVDGSLTGADIAQGSVANAQLAAESGIAHTFTNASDNLTSTPSIVSSVQMRVPADGFLTVDVTGNWSNNDVAGFDIAQCAVTKGTDFAGAEQKYNLNDMDSDLTLALVGFSFHATLPVSVADNPMSIFSNQTFNLMCDEIDGNVTIYDVSMTATFHETSYYSGLIINL